jgi:hypothetical protein
MYPHERSLVKNHQGKPFALIGVNTDEDQGSLKNLVIDQLITWRSFGDGKGGPIARQWQVSTFPTIFIIDHKGVIRRKFVGMPAQSALDGEIDKLMKEAESQSAS